MTTIDLFAWTLSGGFFRFLGAAILIFAIGYSLSAGVSAVTTAFAHILSGLKR